MRFHGWRYGRGGLAIALAMAAFALPAAAQQAPSDLTRLPSVPTDYVPKKTPWGDPDFRGTWPLEHIRDARIPFQRPKFYGQRVWQTDEEFAKRMARAKKSDGNYSAELKNNGTSGLVHWLETSPMARRTSQLVSPANGRLPQLTLIGERVFKAGRSSWTKGKRIDWVYDLDTIERCVSRGFPNAMLPYSSNNGIRIFQSPGFVAIQLEMSATRIIPVGPRAPWPAQVRAYQGQSRGHWEGNTLVIETANLVAGNSATHNLALRAAPPVPGIHNTTMPVSRLAKTVERLTMIGPDTIAYRVTYSDPAVFTAPWTAELDWTRDDSYKIYEYACHEGNTPLRNLIEASHAEEKAYSDAVVAGGSVAK